MGWSWILFFKCHCRSRLSGPAGSTLHYVRPFWRRDWLERVSGGRFNDDGGLGEGWAGDGGCGWMMFMMRSEWWRLEVGGRCDWMRAGSATDGQDPLRV